MSRSPDELYAEQDPLNLDGDCMNPGDGFYSPLLSDAERLSWAIEGFLRVPEWYWDRNRAVQDNILLLLASPHASDHHEADEWCDYIHDRIADWASD
jgi:hypothetical protein